MTFELRCVEVRQQSDWGLAVRASLLGSPQHFDRYVELSIPFSVTIERPCRIDDQHGGSSRNPIDDSAVSPPFEVKIHTTPATNPQFRSSLVFGAGQAVSRFLVPEESLGDPAKSCCGAAAVVPDEHLGQMDQLMLEDSLQGIHAVDAANSRDDFGLFGIRKALEEQVR